MNTFKVALLLAFIVALLPVQVFAQTPTDFGGAINDFSVEYDVQENGLVQVQETIAVTFTEERRGIFRYIPIIYTQNFPNPDVDLETTIVSVLDGSGVEWRYEETMEGDNLRLRIGDPNIYLSGPQTYVIEYTINNVVRFYEDSQELFLDVNGTGWGAAMERVAATIILPSQQRDAVINTTCITGLLGAEGNACTVMKSNERIEVATTQPLAAGENLSFAIAFENGTFVEPSFIEKYRSVFLRNIFIVSPLAVLPWMYRRWSKYGRDIKKSTVVTQFDMPKGVSSAEMGVIADYTADNRDVSSSIIDLAIRGFIGIEDKTKKATAKKRDYVFHLKKPEQDWVALLPHEKTILKGIFSKGEAGEAVPLSSLKNSFYTTLRHVKKDLYESLTERDFFDKNPQEIIGKYTGLAVVMSLVLPIGLLLLSDGRMAGSALGLFISGLIVSAFAQIMPRRSLKGHEVWMHTEGLKRYLEVAEKDRIAMLQAPGSKYSQVADGETLTVDLFEKLLPAAIVVGVEAEWAKKFESVYSGAPDWYSSSTANFDTVFLAQSLSNGVQTIGDTMSSQPSSSSSSGFSGGGSGGGFGGGGGGSW